MLNKKNNKYADKLKDHPLFQDQLLRPDFEIKKLFDITFKFCKELIQGDILNELECYEEDNEISEDSHFTEEEPTIKNNQKKDEEDYTKNNCQKTNCGEKITHISNFDSECNSEESELENDFEETKSQYALLLGCMRLYKLFEHILLKKYLYELPNKEYNKTNIDDFEKAILFFKNKKIIINEEEEQSIYLLQHFSDAVENSFLYQNPLDLDFTILSDDEYMISNIDPNFLFKTIDISHAIVERIYNT